MTRYYKNCRCKNCDYLADNSGHGAEFYNSFEKLKFCPACGESHGWMDSVEWWLSWSVWYKPWTWFSGQWMKKDGWVKP